MRRSDPGGQEHTSIKGEKLEDFDYNLMVYGDERDDNFINDL